MAGCQSGQVFYLEGQGNKAGNLCDSCGGTGTNKWEKPCDDGSCSDGFVPYAQFEGGHNLKDYETCRKCGGTVTNEVDGGNKIEKPCSNGECNDGFSIYQPGEGSVPQPYPSCKTTGVM